jgi:Malic enzyme
MGMPVLGLGDIGPKAAMPVMEEKAMLFKQFADIDAWPICLDTTDTEEIISIVKALAPGFGGINLEDISAPRCFEIEERLWNELDIPVFHDDQHGTAVVTTAALINALKLVRKKPKDIKVVVSGAGAAGTACSKMIMHLGVKNLIGCDSKGAIHNQRTDINQSKRWFADNANPDQEKGSLKEVLKGADVFVGVSAPNILDAGDIRNMEKDAIVFAMANPDPEILPEDARPVAAVVATGRSDYPNQINNVLCFPGIFRGALDCRAKTITEEMKLAASHAIAETLDEQHLNPDYIIPTVLTKA